MLLRNRHPLWIRLILVLGAISLFVLSYQWGNQYQRRLAGPPVISGILIQPPAKLPEISLQDALGRPFDQDDLDPGWTLMAFGDLAGASGQLAAQRLGDVMNRVAERRVLRETLRLVLVTTRDTSGLARELMRLVPALEVLSGEPRQIARLRESIGLGDEPNSGIFVFGPGGYLLAFMPEGQSTAAIAEDLAALHERAFTLIPQDA